MIINRGRVGSKTLQLCYAFGYLAAAVRGEIEPVLSRQRVTDWLKTRLTLKYAAPKIVLRLAEQVYNHLACPSSLPSGNGSTPGEGLTDRRDRLAVRK